MEDIEARVSELERAARGTCEALGAGEIAMTGLQRRIRKLEALLCCSRGC